MPNGTDTWISSRLVPFAARMMVERLTCEHTEGQLVRIIVNEQVQPLEFCGKGDGLCSLDAFVESQGYARRNGDGDFERCYN